MNLNEYVIQEENNSKLKKIFIYFMKNSVNDKDFVNNFLKENKISLEEFDKWVYNCLSSFCSEGNWNRNNNPKVNEDELIRGMEVEYEHTNNPLIAERIALDHLTEFENYYTYLDLAEKLMEKKVDITKIEALLK